MVKNKEMMKGLCTDFLGHASRWAKWVTLVALTCHWPVQAMSWFRPGTPLTEYALTPAETARLIRQAGWPADDPSTWMISVRNPLPGPITCREVQFFQKNPDAQVRVRVLQPPFYIPAGQSRNSLLPDVRKNEIRDWAMQCFCLKASREGACEKLP
jgi:hypothetical protein